jgi:hypothetical protein
MFDGAKPRDLQFSGPLLETLNSYPQTKLSSRPERTRISCLAPLDKAARAPFFNERRILFASATNFYRKSGGAEWRDLRFLFYSRTGF